MAKSNGTQAVVILGIDLAKRSFQLHGVDAQGRLVLTKTLSRARLAAFVARLTPCVVAMEACGSAHHWARTFRAFGHEVRLIAPQFVKPFVKSNKNDAADAEAICEAAQRPSRRSTPSRASSSRTSRPCIGCAPWWSGGGPRRSTNCGGDCWSTGSRSHRGGRH
jgi:transposase